MERDKREVRSFGRPAPPEQGPALPALTLPVVLAVDQESLALLGRQIQQVVEQAVRDGMAEAIGAVPLTTQT